MMSVGEVQHHVTLGVPVTDDLTVARTLNQPFTTADKYAANRATCVSRLRRRES